MEHEPSHPLRIARINAARSVEDIAHAAGVAKSTISRIETWTADPSMSLVRKLCTIFPELSANDFMVPVREHEAQP